MTLKEVLETMQKKPFILGLFTLIFLIMPGLTGIFYYKPGLLISLDWVKLLFVSISFTAPLAIFNSLVVSITSKERRVRYFLDFVAGTALTAISAYVALLIIYIFNAVNYHLFAFPYSNDILILATTEIIILITIWQESKTKRA